MTSDQMNAGVPPVIRRAAGNMLGDVANKDTLAKVLSILYLPVFFGTGQGAFINRCGLSVRCWTGCQKSIGNPVSVCADA